MNTTDPPPRATRSYIRRLANLAAPHLHPPHCPPSPFPLHFTRRSKANMMMFKLLLVTCLVAGAACTPSEPRFQNLRAHDGGPDKSAAPPAAPVKASPAKATPTKASAPAPVADKAAADKAAAAAAVEMTELKRIKAATKAAADKAAFQKWFGDAKNKNKIDTWIKHCKEAPTATKTAAAAAAKLAPLEDKITALKDSLGALQGDKWRVGALKNCQTSSEQTAGRLDVNMIDDAKNWAKVKLCKKKATDGIAKINRQLKPALEEFTKAQAVFVTDKKWKYGPGICGSDGKGQYFRFAPAGCFTNEMQAACVAIKDDEQDKALAYCGGLKDPGVDQTAADLIANCCPLNGEAKLQELCNAQGKKGENSMCSRCAAVEAKKVAAEAKKVAAPGLFDGKTQWACKNAVMKRRQTSRSFGGRSSGDPETDPKACESFIKNCVETASTAEIKNCDKQATEGKGKGFVK